VSLTPRSAESADWTSGTVRCTQGTLAARSPSAFRLSGPTCQRQLIVTSNKPFRGTGEVFGDDVVAAAMIDRLVHHADVVALGARAYMGKWPRSAILASSTPSASASLAR
jgi:hypothetical protein